MIILNDQHDYFDVQHDYFDVQHDDGAYDDNYYDHDNGDYDVYCWCLLIMIIFTVKIMLKTC